MICLKNESWIFAAPGAELKNRIPMTTAALGTGGHGGGAQPVAPPLGASQPASPLPESPPRSPLRPQPPPAHPAAPLRASSKPPPHHQPRLRQQIIVFALQMNWKMSKQWDLPGACTRCWRVWSWMLWVDGGAGGLGAAPVPPSPPALCPAVQAEPWC